jgi:hypothetical protein
MPACAGMTKAEKEGKKREGDESLIALKQREAR